MSKLTDSHKKQSKSLDVESLIAPIKQFLLVDTPDSWINQALSNQSTLLIDHANCEKKAASTALNLIYRYIDFPELLTKLSKLAREELRHFEQVLSIMKKRDIEYVYVSASRYAGEMRSLVSKKDPHMLIDTLICGAIIEARSCERFAALSPHLDRDLADFYNSLLKSEARHYNDYLKLAENYINSRSDLSLDYMQSKIQEMLEKESELITQPDQDFRFHSGPTIV
jgi:tRNA-(ms[2]io[6]A)-hydroxylase